MQYKKLDLDVFAKLLPKQVCNYTYISMCNNTDQKVKNRNITKEILYMHPEIQTTIFESILKTKEGSKHNHSMIYSSNIVPLSNMSEIKAYVSILFLFFDMVFLMVIDNLVYGYEVRKINYIGKSVFKQLQEEKKLNAYIALFNSKYSNDHKDAIPKVYQFSADINSNPVLLDEYISYLISAAKVAQCLTIPLFGFTINGIETNPLLNNLILSCKNMFVLFNDNLSIGAYILSNDYDYETV